MGQHYLLDAFAAPITSARILDVRDPSNLQTMMNGSFIVRVPAAVSVTNPANLTDLVTQKYQSLLANNPSFTRVTFDDLLDATHVDPTAGPGLFGQRGCMAVMPGGTFISILNAGSGTALTGSAPTSAMVTWEVYSVTTSDPSNDRQQRTYTELPSTPANFTAQVSFNGGGTYNAVTDSAAFTIAGPDQGTAFIIKLTNASAGRLYVGSWAVVY